MGTIRIKDVAKRAGVSVATITRVINNSGYVSAATREKAERAIRELGYIPNHMASALKSRNTGIIGTVLPSMENPFFTDVNVALDRQAVNIGYHTLTMTTDSDERHAVEAIHEMMGRMVEGIFLVGDIQAPERVIQEVIDKKIPLVMIERPMDFPNADKVLINAYDGSAMAARVLLGHGHRRIGYVGVVLRHSVESSRYEGFAQTLAAGGVQLSETDTIFVRDYEAKYGYQAMKALAKRRGLPTAVFFASDMLACGALQYLYAHHLRVPDDISIIGYDNTVSALSSPAISSIALPVEDIAKTAMVLFRERKDEERMVGKSVEISTYYVDRNTVCNIKEEAKA